MVRWNVYTEFQALEQKIKEFICKHLKDNKTVNNSQHRFVKNNNVELIQFPAIPCGRDISEICGFSWLLNSFVWHHNHNQSSSNMV